MSVLERSSTELVVIMLGALSAIESRQSDILDCLSNLTDLLLANTNPQEMELQCKRIRHYASETILTAITLGEHIRHVRREKRHRQKKNKKEYMQELEKYHKDFNTVVEQFNRLKL